MDKMALELNVSTGEEFEKLVASRDYRISKALIDTVLNNLNGKKRYYHALTVNIENEMVAYDITIDRDQFSTVLQNNLKDCELQEEYETCSEILKALKSLEDVLQPHKKRGRPKKVI